MNAEYQQLISLTKLYLLQEFSPKEWKVCEQETFDFFKEQAKKAPKVPAIQQKTDSVKVEAPVQSNTPKVETPVQSITPKVEAPKKEIPVEQKTTLTLEKAQTSKVVDLSDIKTFMQAQFPSITLVESPPCDREAKTIDGQKKQDCAVIILSFDKRTHPLLKNLEIAINQELTSATVISAQRVENENSWEEILKQKQLKLIIGSDYGLYSLQNMMRYYRDIPKQAKYFLGNIPLLLLTDLSLYLKEPKLKPALWRAIIQQIRS